MENNWENFVESELLNFLRKHDLQKITVSNGKNKATIKVNSKGEFKVETSINKTM